MQKNKKAARSTDTNADKVQSKI